MPDPATEPRKGAATGEWLQARIEELTKSNQTIQSCVLDLEACNERLRQEIETGSRKLQIVMRRLALAEERAGHPALAQTIRTVAAGQSDPSFDAAWAVLSAQACGDEFAGEPASCLSAREREVLRLITEGNRTPCIAERLAIATATVEVHRRNIMRKLGLHSIAALTKYAVRAGLTSL
ncbi:MAG: LuxR C-terminal-related transcriptional regulator [Burkholderiales bacterium]